MGGNRAKQVSGGAAAGSGPSAGELVLEYLSRSDDSPNKNRVPSWLAVVVGRGLRAPRAGSCLTLG